MLSFCQNLSGHHAAIYALCAGIKPLSFYSADGNGWVVYWQNALQNEGLALAQIPANVFSLCFIPQYSLLAIGAMQGIVYAIDPTQPRPNPTALQLSGSVFSLLSYQHHLLAGTANGYLYSIDPHTWQTNRIVRISDKALRQIVLHPHLPLAAIAAADTKVYIIDLNRWQLIQTLSFHTQSVFSLCFSPDGQYLLSGSRDAQLAIWQTSPTFALYHAIPAHLATINRIAYSHNGQYIATAARDKTIKLWNGTTFALLKVIDPAKNQSIAHRYSVNSLLALPNNPYLLSAGDDKTILVWQW